MGTASPGAWHEAWHGTFMSNVVDGTAEATPALGCSGAVGAQQQQAAASLDNILGDLERGDVHYLLLRW